MLLHATPPTPIDAALGVRCHVVELQTHKAGNHPHECEDSACCARADGWNALSDGAGEGIFSREWSRLLVDSFIRSRPNLADAVETAVWLDGCRRDWLAQINPAKLGWAHRNRVERHGTGGTLLTLRLYRDAPMNALAFHVQAVGDSCLFWVRDQHCKAFFPRGLGDDFTAAPDLFSTHGDQLPTVLHSGDFCDVGDRFFLATDAVSHWLMQMLERGRAVDWDRFAAMARDDWREFIDALRKPHNPDDPHAPISLENDDCTMLMVSVAPATDLV